MTHGPDYSHAGEFIDWGNEGATLDEQHVARIELALANIGQDVELMRWSPEDEVVKEIERNWVAQSSAIRRHIGPLVGMRVTLRSKMHKQLGVKIAYVRFNRKRAAMKAVA